MKPLLLLLSIFLSGYVFCQNSIEKENQPFPIEDVYKDWLSRWKYEKITCDTLYYIDKVSTSVIDSTINKISKNRQFKIYRLYTNEKSSPLELTEQEQNYLIQELQKLKSFKWNSGLFPKSKMITETEIETVLAKTEGLKTETERNMCSIIYTFSKPIFIRNGTICLYLNQACYRTNNTQLEFDFYIHEKERWERYSQVYIYYEPQK